ncbi:bifunctional DNA primase/polymerase [Sorangium sp. So ce315]|uniref:bifunctional DNA primase/polymerase n=1 Tax=Sorangium sp. So ce315 TaxID=3133299 RepID=UPI003F5E6C23
MSAPHLNGAAVVAAREHAAAYLGAGWVPVPVPFREKAPSGEAWQTRTLDEARASFDRDFPPGMTMNVGVLLGMPSTGLVDVDLDCDEAVPFADLLLPPTATFGRTGRQGSHRLFLCEVKTAQFRDPLRVRDRAQDKAMIVEIRSDGAQTVFPGSTHVSGEPITFEGSELPQAIDAGVLRVRVGRIAAGVLLARYWPGGGRHEMQLALAGALLRSGWDPDLALEFLCLVCGLAGDEDRAKRETTVRGTMTKIEAGERVTGWGTLAKAFDPSVFRTVRKWLGGDKPPEIVVSANMEHVTDQAIEAIERVGLDDPDRRIWRRGSTLVRVVRDAEPPPLLTREPNTPMIQAVPPPAVREAVASGATWIRLTTTRTGAEKRSRVVPPEWVVQGILARTHWPVLAPLEQVCETPLLLPDGTVLGTPGYDERTGILYEPNTEYPTVPDQPTAGDVVRAIAVIDDVICDFSFETPEHRTGFFAAVLTPMSRNMFQGPAPLFLFDASTPGTGKGLLAKLAGLISTGREPAAGQFTEDEAEMRKRLTSCLMDGDRILLFDNVVGKLGGAPLCTALTESQWSDRVLGSSKGWSGPIGATFYATANNADLGADMDRRVCHVRITANAERPEQRQGFRYSPLLPHVRAHRAPLAVAALTILRRYTAAGCPPVTLRPWGSFESWTRLVLGALVFAGLPDPGPARDALAENADADADHRRAFVAGWAELVGREGAAAGLTARRAAELMQTAPAFRDAVEGLLGLAKLQALSVTPLQLSGLLRRMKGRIVGGLRIVEGKEDRKGIKLWSVERVA